MGYIVDTSVIIERAVSKLVEEKKIEGEILLPKAVMAELEHQANSGREEGLIGLEELQTLQAMAKDGSITIKLIGERPTFYQKDNARGGEIDSYIRDIAYNEGATLVTADRIQSESAKALDILVMFIKLEVKETLEIETFFDDHTMSVHLKDGAFPVAKRGQPGDWKIVRLEEEPLTIDRVQKMAKEVVERCRADPKSFIEIARAGSTIVQFREYRVVIVKPPVSDGWEITAVKPLVKLDLDEYKLPEKILERLVERSSGIIISGQVGSGKSTFASALAEYYAKSGRITKTIESPRDLVLSDDITQYSKNFGTSEEIHDILFLSRPDNVIFDEMRDSPDFKLYIDIRLGGSSVIGVLHAASPIDTIQRFISRMDVGMIPSVLDTILFIENGTLGQVFVLEMKVKVPSGMTESDLARPVINVKDLESGNLMFEIYSYGEETVVIPVQKEQKSPAFALAEKQVKKEMAKYVSNVEVEMISANKVRVYVPKGERARVIGPKGTRIAEIEKKVGISIDIETLNDTSRKELKRMGYHLSERGRSLIFQLDHPGIMVDVYIEDDYIFSSTTSKKGEIRVNKRSDIGDMIVHAFDTGMKVYVKG